MIKLSWRSEAQHAEQAIEGLKANITTLEAKLRETEDTVRRKEAASQKMEENLSTEIRDLQSAVKKKEEDLESRQSEINDLKSKIDVMTVQVSHLGLAIDTQKQRRRVRPNMPSRLSRVSRQTSPRWRLDLERRKKPPIERRCRPKDGRKSERPRSAIYRVQ